MPFKRFIVFAFNAYYPTGGFNDREESFDTLEEAQRYVTDEARRDYFQIFDCETRELVRDDCQETT